MLSLYEVTTVIYHGNCADGHSAAYTIWVSNLTNKRDIEYIPSQYGMEPKDMTGKCLLILDFSFSEDITKRLIKETDGKILIIDHHDTAERLLENIPDEYKIFDMTHCGAVLTWNWVVSQDSDIFPPTRFLQYIEGRDLWKKDILEEVPWMDFNFGFCDEPFDFERTDDIADSNDYMDEILKLGHMIKTQLDKRVAKQLDKLAFRLVKDPLDASKLTDRQDKAGYIVVAIGNVTSDNSDVGDACLEKFPFVDMYVGFYIDSVLQETQYSFRSRGYPSNKLGEYLKSHNKNVKAAGGHPCASGCRFNNIVTELPLEIISSKEITRLAKGNKYEIKSSDVYAATLKAMFPDLVTILDKQYIVVRDDTIHYKGGVNDIDLEVGDVVTCLFGNYGKSIVIDKQKKLSDITL